MTISNNDPRLPNLLKSVRRIAAGYARRLPNNVALDDLAAAGYLGVATAMTRHGEDGYGNFEAFALAHARGAILDELRRCDPLTRNARRSVRKAHTAVRTLRSTLQREPEDGEVAEKMGLDVGEYRDVQRLGATVNVPVDTCADSGDAIFLILKDRSSLEEEIAQRDEARRVKRIVAEEVARMTPRQATVATLAFEDELPLAHIAIQMGVTTSRVSQLRTACLAKLRDACVANDVGVPDLAS